MDLKDLNDLGLLACMELTDAALPTIARMKGLKSFSANGTKITQQGLELLKRQRPDIESP